MIIITGCDNTGKTTLAKHLSEKFNIPLAEKFTPLPPRNLSDWNKWFEWVKNNIERKEELIYDRFLIDEFVYGPLLRGGYKCTFEQMAILSSMLIMKQPLFIYTHRPLANILESFNEREQYPKEQDICKIVCRFNRVIKAWPVNQLTNIARSNFEEDRKYTRISYIVKNYLNGGQI